MKLWHDDVRMPPDDSWVWAKTNEDATRALVLFDVTECSLDHDLGAVPTGNMDPRDVMHLRGTGSETGLDLVRWMVEHDCVPASVTIHSWNPPGAKAMADALLDAGHACAVEPFRLPDLL